MKKNYSFYLGLEYPNALFFGILFIAITIYGIYNSFFCSHAPTGSDLVIQLVFISVPLLFGLLSLSFKTIKVDLTTNKISITTNYFLVFPRSEVYDLSDIKKLKIKQVKANYSAGGGILATARQSFSAKETNMIFYSSNVKPYFTIERVSIARKSQLVDFFTKTLNFELVES